jgi:hypothetical protein
MSFKASLAHERQYDRSHDNSSQICPEPTAPAVAADEVVWDANANVLIDKVPSMAVEEEGHNKSVGLLIFMMYIVGRQGVTNCGMEMFEICANISSAVAVSASSISAKW